MLFSFALGGTDARRLAILEDALRPLFYGLRRSGHRVIAFAHGLAPPPAINLLVEHEGADIVRRVAQGRIDVPGARIGIVCADDVDGVTANPDRGPALREAAAAADFVWTLGAADTLAGVVAPERLANVEYGFDPIMPGRRLVADPALRTADLVVYGLKTAYRAQLADRLKTADVTPFVVEPGRFPDYIASDLLSRSKLVIVSRDHEAERAPAAGRIAKALSNGALVVAETPALGGCPLEPYVTLCTPDEMPGRCRDLMADGRFAERGLAQLEAFRAQTRMADGVAAALRLPIFASFGGG